MTRWQCLCLCHLVLWEDVDRDGVEKGYKDHCWHVLEMEMELHMSSPMPQRRRQRQNLIENDREDYISALHGLNLPVVDLDQGVANLQTRLVWSFYNLIIQISSQFGWNETMTNLKVNQAEIDHITICKWINKWPNKQTTNEQTKSHSQPGQMITLLFGNE